MTELNNSSQVAGDVKDTATNSNPDNSQSGGEQQEQKAENKYIPYDRFKEVIERKNEYENKLKELEQRLREEEEKKLAEKEEYKTLFEKTKQELESYKTYEEKVKQYEEVVKSLAESELEQVKQQIGEDKFQDIVELLDLENVEPLKLLEKLPKIKKLAGENKAPINTGQAIPQKGENDIKEEFEMLKRKLMKGELDGPGRIRYMELLKQI